MIIMSALDISFDVDYIPTSDANFDYYILRLDILVEPESFATLKRFTMTPAHDSNSSFPLTKINDKKLPTNTDEVFTTNISAMEGADFYFAEREIAAITGEVWIKFLSQNLTNFIAEVPEKKVGAPGFTILGERDVFGDYDGVPMEIRRADRSNSASSSDLKNDRGITYAALYYGVYQVPKNVRERKIAFRFNELEIWGQVGQPSFKLNSDKDYVTITATWQNKFDNKTISAEVSDKTGGQYLSQYFVKSTLPRTTTKTETTFSYSDY